jgi:predicted DNA-binding transcriptional regulator YafY
MNQKIRRGFEKEAGISDFFGKIKNFFKRSPAPPKQTNPEPTHAERQKPKYFRTKKMDPAHKKALNSAIRKGFNGKGGDVTIKYKKANGDIVERKVTPYTAKNTRLLLGHDHHRGELRSYRADRIIGIS